jgi:hypothetical protein
MTFIPSREGRSHCSLGNRYIENGNILLNTGLALVN